MRYCFIYVNKGNCDEKDVWKSKYFVINQKKKQFIGISFVLFTFAFKALTSEMRQSGWDNYNFLLSKKAEHGLLCEWTNYAANLPSGKGKPPILPSYVANR